MTTSQTSEEIPRDCLCCTLRDCVKEEFFKMTMTEERGNENNLNFGEKVLIVWRKCRTEMENFRKLNCLVWS